MSCSSAPPARSPGAERRVILDGSRLVIEALIRSGADTYVGYPITPANLMYAYGFQRFPTALAAPDELTCLQWMSGLAATGRLPVSATSFAGFALMLESINMAYMMELPMVIILVQRLGPSTGSATIGATGDLALLVGAVSGGYALPVLSPTNFRDCWELASLAQHTAVRLRSPVVLLTSKEMVMTRRDFDLSRLAPIDPVQRDLPGTERRGYETYRPGPDLVPPLLPVGNPCHQVRLTSSTHDQSGLHQSLAPTALANTRRLHEKMIVNLPDYLRYDLDEQPGSDTIVIAWDVTGQAARHAVEELRAAGRRVSLLLPKTLIPFADALTRIISRYERVVVAEENLTGQLRRLLFGTAGRPGLIGVNLIGRLVSPQDIVAAVEGASNG